jgi:hypothetical protein
VGAGGRFYLLGGIPSASKTMLVNNLADNICINGQPVLVFSYDDGKTELRYRTFARFRELLFDTPVKFLQSFRKFLLQYPHKLPMQIR